MLKGGNASIYINSMDKAISFYTQKLKLKLKYRIANEWAEIDAGGGLTIGLHMAQPPKTVPAGTIGAINIELQVTEPMEQVIEKLALMGVPAIGDIQNYENVRIVSIADPDGNIIVLAEVLNGDPN